MVTMVVGFVYSHISMPIKLSISPRGHVLSAAVIESFIFSSNLFEFYFWAKINEAVCRIVPLIAVS